MNQAKKLRQYSQDEKLTGDSINVILSAEKQETQKLTFTNSQLKKYFPSSYTLQQIESTMIELLEKWKKTIQN